MEILWDGRPVKASCELSATANRWSLILHSRGGTAGTKDERNPGYLKALELVLARLASLNATLVDVFLDSQVTKGLPEDQRRLLPEAPLRLDKATATTELRRQITRNAARTGIEGRRTSNGNPTKRIQLHFSFDSLMAFDEVESIVVRGEPRGQTHPMGAENSTQVGEKTPPPPAEIEAEQRYLDNAWRLREEERDEWKNAPRGGAARSDQRQIGQIAAGRLRNFDDADSPAAFGRIDTTDDDLSTVYVGKQHIWDRRKDLVVYDWRSPPARRFSSANLEAPDGLKRKRTFEFDRLRLVSFEDLVVGEIEAQFHDLQARADRTAGIGDDALLRELESARSGEMRDIAKTIQSAQFDLISADRNQLLIIQGGPGTGKTAVALHRLSWILFNHEEIKPENVMVIGPSKTYLRYISKVLPGLGDRGIPQRDVVSLAGDPLPISVLETPEVQKLKGSLKMVPLLREALKRRIRIPKDDLVISVRGRRFTFSASLIEKRIGQLTRFSYLEGRREFRSWYFDEVAVGLRLEADEIRGDVERDLEQIWPTVNTRSFLYDLLSSRDRILDAASDELSAQDVRAIVKPLASRVSEQVWSLSDLPLWDFADQLINGTPDKQYDHIVVDEAQDLSPMQLLMVKRRSLRGSMTLVGDIAQSTGPHARSSWDDVVQLMRGNLPIRIENLAYGYRLPREIHQFVEPLRLIVAPSTAEGRPVRSSGVDPVLVKETVDIDQAVVEACSDFLESDIQTVGVICPDSAVDDQILAFERSGLEVADTRNGQLAEGINVVAVSACKGLEFDAVVVVDPEAIAFSGNDGLSLLYVAMTRTTRHLIVVFRNSPIPGDANWPTSGTVGQLVKDWGADVDGREASERLGRVVEYAVAEVLDLLRAFTPDVRSSVLKAVLQHIDDSGHEIKKA